MPIFGVGIVTKYYDQYITPVAYEGGLWHSRDICLNSVASESFTLF